ncbi:DUF2813 domain-containing protein [Flammeovirga pectinis]|uniref:DUF2813 domain-containing protein n=1 Tax=Flammeovirga pectinis TaxID=2494373 RepID=A0A3S9P0L0_9BACT|nr:AAA family ATPase [Flammeovirga pectinis]AZQ61721.1 DUF2813 domain-containing protein [Flammeovirga pectinis]
MTFDTLEIKDFKGIQSLTVEGLKKINFIVGKNNSGKSTLLDALYLIAKQGDPRSIIELFDIRQSSLRKGKDLKFLFPRANTKLFPDLLAFDNEKSWGIRLQAYSGDLKDGHLIGLENIDLEIDGIRLLNEKSTRRESLLKQNDKGFSGHASSTIVVRKHEDTTFYNRKVPFEFKFNDTQKGIPINYVPSSPTYQNLLEETQSVVQKRKKTELVAVLNEIEPLVEDIEILGEEIGIGLKGWEEIAPLKTMGEGFVKLFGLVVAMLNAKDGICLIDEIENGLHYSVLEKIWKHVIHVANELNVQLFITTHNIEILESFINSVEGNEQLKQTKEETTLNRILFHPEKGHLAQTYSFEEIQKQIELGNELRGR